MHKVASETSKKQRTVKQQKKLRKTPNFGVGDYVLVGVPEPAKMTGRKPFLKWRGPYRITETANNHVFKAENIVDHSKRWVHVERIRLYSDEKFEVTEEMKKQIFS